MPIFAEHVPTQLTGEADLERALRALRRRHDGLLVVTLGARGAAALEGGVFHLAPAFRVKTVDTTGAGRRLSRRIHICVFVGISSARRAPIRQRGSRRQLHPPGGHERRPHARGNPRNPRKRQDP